MRLLATSPQIAVPGGYPYERKYFAYLWRWSRLLERRDKSELWTAGDLSSLAQEARKPLVGPPLWPSGLLGAKGEVPPSMSRQMFDVAWGELSRRATSQVREKHGDPNAEVRYYAEKHQETRLVDLDELPPLNVLVLLRDPRDTFVSFHAFDAKRRREGTGRFEAALPGRGETPEDRTNRFIERERQRLRWIAGLPSGQKFPVFRYEDLVTDLPRTGAQDRGLALRPPVSRGGGERRRDAGCARQRRDSRSVGRALEAGDAPRARRAVQPRARGGAGGGGVLASRGEGSGRKPTATFTAAPEPTRHTALTRGRPRHGIHSPHARLRWLVLARQPEGDPVSVSRSGRGKARPGDRRLPGRADARAARLGRRPRCPHHGGRPRSAGRAASSWESSIPSWSSSSRRATMRSGTSRCRAR